MDYHFLSQTILFRDFEEQEIEAMLEYLGKKQTAFQKGDIVCHAGDVVSSLGMVLSGSVQIENHDFTGNTSILDSIRPGFVFAETYAMLPNEPMMVDVVAAEYCEILFISISALFHADRRNASHDKLIRNLLLISSQKNLNLSRRIFHTTPKSIRGRLLSYLSFQSAKEGSLSFTIPFNRQQLADFLNVDRSALSNELGKMQREGLLTVKKNRFILSKRGLS